jgi:ABC-2 type transport system ATP-binding protein
MIKDQIIQPAALEILNLKKEFPEGNVLAVNGISFSVSQGEIFAFLGPNGAGKSTTISMAATQLRPTSGIIKLFGNDISVHIGLARKRIGICPQELVFYENLSVMENLIFFGKMHNKSGKGLKEYAELLIAHTGLGEKTNTLASRLSGGMKRRLNLIIALVHDPDFLFLDEPTAGLDPQTRRLIWEFLLDLKKKGKTIFLTTHYMDEADFLSDQVAIIDHGKIIALDSPFDLKRKYSEGDVIEFKFKEPDEMVLAAIGEKMQQDTNSLLKDFSHIEEDNLFRIALKEGLTKIPILLELLHSINLHISDMNVKANSLENVFLNLTGRRLRN